MIAADLEPVAGACLAINLAYLGLTRFRYRDKIREIAREQMKLFKMADNQFPVHIKELLHYQHLQSLCALSNMDYQADPNENKQAKINGSVWGNVYQGVFSAHHDRHLSYLCAGLAGLTLFAGVAEGIKNDFWILPWVYHANLGTTWLVFLAIAAALPVALVWVGRNIVFHSGKYAVLCRTQIELSMKNNSQTVAIPDEAQERMRSHYPMARQPADAVTLAETPGPV